MIGKRLQRVVSWQMVDDDGRSEVQRLRMNFFARHDANSLMVCLELTLEFWAWNMLPRRNLNMTMTMTAECRDFGQRLSREL